jgi:hypothetical protein
VSNVDGRLKIAKEFLDRLERVVHVKKVKKKYYLQFHRFIYRIVENIVTIMQGKKRV